MNPTLDLDAMKVRWAAQERQLEQSLRLNVDLLRDKLAGKAAEMLAPQRRMKVFELVCHAAMITWLSVFVLRHWGEPRFALPGLLLDLFYMGIAALDLHHRRVLDGLDFSAPVSTLQTRIEALRSLRLRTAKWIFMIAPLAWIPFPVVLFKSLFDVDFSAWVSSSYWSINFAVALAWIPLLLLGAQFIGRRFAGSPRLQTVLDAIAGQGIAESRRFSDLLRRFDDDASTSSSELPAAVRAAMQRSGIASTQLALAVQDIAADASRQLLIAILAASAFLLANGSFMALHGGQFGLIVPAIILHAGAVLAMIFAIRQRAAIAALHLEATTADLRAGIVGIVQSRLTAARSMLILSPTLALAGALVAVQLGGAEDLRSLWALVPLTLVATLALVRRIVVGRGSAWPSLTIGPSAEIEGWQRRIAGPWLQALRRIDTEVESSGNRPTDA